VQRLPVVGRGSRGDGELLWCRAHCNAMHVSSNQRRGASAVCPTVASMGVKRAAHSAQRTARERALRQQARRDRPHDVTFRDARNAPPANIRPHPHALATARRATLRTHRPIPARHGISRVHGMHVRSRPLSGALACTEPRRRPRPRSCRRLAPREKAAVAHTGYKACGCDTPTLLAVYAGPSPALLRPLRACRRGPDP
jgi:hypothetical protein